MLQHLGCSQLLQILTSPLTVFPTQNILQKMKFVTFVVRKVTMHVVVGQIVRLEVQVVVQIEVQVVVQAEVEVKVTTEVEAVIVEI